MTDACDLKPDLVKRYDQSAYEFAMWEGWPSPQYAEALMDCDYPGILMDISLRRKNGKVQGGL